MSNDWARLVNSTTAQYLKGATPLILRRRILTALMESKGRVKLNSFGTNLNWKNEYKQSPISGFADGDTLTFERRDRFIEAVLPWRAYSSTDMMSQMERYQNKGDSQIINVYGEIAQRLMTSFTDQFGDQFYIDGNATGNSRLMHGLESFLAADNSPNLGNGFAKPNDTYAGLNTLYNSYGGSWTGTWPDGTGTTDYDFWSPVLVNYTDGTSGAFSATTKTWPNTCKEALRKGITKSRKSKSREGMLDLILLQDTLLEQFKNSITENLQVHRNEAVGLVALGFTDALNYDGVDITTEFGMPASTGYGINTMQMELHSLAPDLFNVEGPFYSEENVAWLFQIMFYGNLKCIPKFFVKFYPYG